MGSTSHVRIVPFIVEGQSMDPLFRSGDIILVEMSLDTGAPPRVGEFVAWRQNQTVTAHRLLESGEQCLSKGEHREDTDVPWKPQQYVGRVIGRVRSHQIVRFDHPVWKLSRWIWLGLNRAEIQLVRLQRAALSRKAQFFLRIPLRVLRKCKQLGLTLVLGCTETQLSTVRLKYT